MSYRVVVPARARHDVDAIYDRLAERSPEGAQRWLNQFQKATEALENHPLIGPVAPESLADRGSLCVGHPTSVTWRIPSRGAAPRIERLESRPQADDSG